MYDTGILKEMGSNVLDYEILNSRRQSDELTDVTLVIGETEFQAHKVSMLFINAIAKSSFLLNFR